jgi:hypothetical protein
MVKGILLALGFLAVAGALSAQNSRPPMTCVHSEGAWDAQASRLHVIFLSNTCDVATGSKAYSWTEADDDDYGGMVTAQTNAMAFTQGCLQESLMNKRPCSDSAKDLIVMAARAARGKRESLCSRHPDWWVITVSTDGIFGALESCGK